MIQDDHPPSQQEEPEGVVEAAKERLTPQTPKEITEPEVDKDAIILEQVLKAASAANLGKQTVQVATPVTVGMADALLGEAEKMWFRLKWSAVPTHVISSFAIYQPGR